MGFHHCPSSSLISMLMMMIKDVEMPANDNINALMQLNYTTPSQRGGDILLEESSSLKCGHSYSSTKRDGNDDDEEEDQYGSTHDKKDAKSSSKNKKHTRNAQSIEQRDYIQVRARRGQATDSHSLAERARREKINKRMKFLQDLVPGCSKSIGKALMLDEIINYVQSLQQQVEFLSMKLANHSQRVNFDIDINNLTIEEMLHGNSWSQYMYFQMLLKSPNPLLCDHIGLNNLNGYSNPCQSSINKCDNPNPIQFHENTIAWDVNMSMPMRGNHFDLYDNPIIAPTMETPSCNFHNLSARVTKVDH